MKEKVLILVILVSAIMIIILEEGLPSFDLVEVLTVIMFFSIIALFALALNESSSDEKDDKKEDKSNTDNHLRDQADNNKTVECTAVHTQKAPGAIGTYSQAIKAGDTVYLSGQIPLSPDTMTIIEGDIAVQVRRVFDNLSAVTEAAGGSLQNIVKLNIYLTDLTHFDVVNAVMTEYFQAPYPARAVIGVNSLPKNVSIEVDAIMQVAGIGEQAGLVSHAINSVKQTLR